jgi:hypothetical protein
MSRKSTQLILAAGCRLQAAGGICRGAAFAILLSIVSVALVCFAQQNDDLELTLDVSQATCPSPKIFKPAIDLSGAGYHQDSSWPQTVAAAGVLGSWQKDIGFAGFYRLQYNLWEINQLAKDKVTQEKLLSNYQKIIQDINDAGGTVILDIFGTPAGLGKVLDSKSPPWDLKAFKALAKELMRDLSCQRRWNIWYEVWNAPDLEEFFLGGRQEYFNLYRAVAEAVKELEAEYKVHIPLGGPSTSWWFQNSDGNTIVTPEKSLIYELIKFAAQAHLPLDFISWHAYSTDAAAEKESTIYKNKTATKLISDWLSYFNFDRHTPLVVDEWNYDRDANVLPERKEKSYIAASFIISRIKNMYEAGVDLQLYFCLQDFQGNPEAVVRNVGLWDYDCVPKATYLAFRMLKALGNNLYPLKFSDNFAGVLATKSADGIALLIYNYIDPEIVKSYFSVNIATLNNTERRVLLNIINSEQLDKILAYKLDIAGLHLTNRTKALLKKTQELHTRAKKFEVSQRTFKLALKNLKDSYIYQRFTVDSSCSLNCAFSPKEEKEVTATELYQEVLSLQPYSLNLIILKRKPKTPATTASSQLQSEFINATQ